MPLIATEGDTKPRQLPPAGTHVARCYSVIDLGTQTVNFAGEEKQQHKVHVTWELPDELAVFSAEKGEQPFVLSKTYTLSLNEKATLRHDLESWRGKAFTEEELKGFDIQTLAGVPCLLTVIHKQSQDGKKTFANVTSISKLAKGMTCPQPINDLVTYGVWEDRNVTFSALPEWLRKKIESCKEWTDPDSFEANDPPRETEEPAGEVPF